MSRKIITIVASLFFNLAIYNAYAYKMANTTNADLKLVITDIPNTNGTIRVGLFNSESSYIASDDSGATAFRKTIVNIDLSKPTNVIFKSIPSGVYAIKLFQDEDNSGVLKKDWLGRPKEAVGLSNNIDISGGRPSFEQIKFYFDKTHNIQIIKMQKR